MRDDPPDPQYLDAFLQGARFALFALEGRLTEDDRPISPELAGTLDDVHEMFSATRDGLEAREDPSQGSTAPRYLGKN